MERRKELTWRLFFVFFVFVALSVVVMYRVVKVSVVEGDKWRKKGAVNIKKTVLAAERGNIYSEDYDLLCTSLQFFDVHMDVSVVGDEVFNENVDSLAYMLGTSPWSKLGVDEWGRRLRKARQKRSQYLRIARRLDVDEYSRLEKFPILRLGWMEGGRIVESTTKRVKPFRGLSSRVIGKTKDFSNKDVGLELTYDKFLRGPERPIVMRRVSMSKKLWVPVRDMEDLDVKRGNDILTTLDVGVMDIVHSELEQGLINLDASSGVAIVMDVETGAVKSISNLRKSSAGVYSEVYNDGVGVRYEPGSTIKLASVLALLDDNKCNSESLVDLNGGKFRFYDQLMRDYRQHGMRIVSLKKAFKMSSNVGIARMVDTHYGSKEGWVAFLDKMKSFGLLDNTGVDIKGEAVPKVLDPLKGEFSGVTLPWMAHGYAWEFTPLQILSFYNAVANDGKYMTPYFVTDILEDEKVIKHFDPKVKIEHIASSKAVKDVQEMLEAVVESGTATNLQSNIVTIAGKTGTTVVDYDKQVDNNRRIASFAGYFPAKSPKYSVIVVVKDPVGHTSGSTAAGPIFKNIAERITTMVDNVSGRSTLATANFTELPNYNAGNGDDFKKIYKHTGVKYATNTKSRWVEANPYEGRLMLKRKAIEKKITPDVRGMGARDAAYILENMGLKVKMSGVGKVKVQSIKPGTKIKGQEIQLKLD